MATRPERVRVPESCKLCGASGTVTLETTVTGDSIRMTWCCRACRQEWPLTREEEDAIRRRSRKRDR